MNTPRLCLTLALLLLAAAACGDPEGPDCPTNAEQLGEALDGAGPGATVTLCEGTRYSGTFTVGPGVTLQGDAGSTLASRAGAAVVMEGGAGQPARLRDLAVELPDAGDAAVGVLGTAGEVELEGVTVTGTRGMGVVMDGVDSVTARLLVVDGQLDQERLDGVASRGYTSADVMVAGLVVAGGQVDLSDLTVSGTAGFGVVLYGVEGTWSGGVVQGAAGTNVLLEDARVELTGLTLQDGLAPNAISTLSWSWGLVAAGGADVRTTDLAARRLPGVGLLQVGEGSRGAHLRPRLTDNGGAGVQVQSDAASTADDPSLMLDGAVIARNTGSGVLLTGVGGAVVQNSLIGETLGEPRTSGAQGFVASDGLQVAGQTAELRLSDALIYGHGRVGLLLDGQVDAASEAGPATLCGPAAIDDDTWACASGQAGAVSCTRTGGPPDATWDCNDLVDGTMCVTQYPEVQEGAPDDAPAGVSPVPDACQQALASLDGQAPLEEVDLTASAATPASAWDCTNDEAAGTRTCLNAHAGDFEDLAGDNPTRTNGPGWTCEDTDAGRTCTWDGYGLRPQTGAAVGDGAVDRDDTLAERDLEADTQGTILSTLPPLTTTPAVGDALAEGVVGSLVAEDGRVMGVEVGEGGFE